MSPSKRLARFKGLLRKCPNHGFTIDHQVGILYNGFNEKICVMLDSEANGGIMKKSGADAMTVIVEFTTNSRGWSKERHNSQRVAAINEAEESSFAKELAELRVRVDQMDTSRREYPVPPTSVIAVTKPDTSPAPIEDVNYVKQGGGPNRPYNNNYRPNQGAVISIIIMRTVLIPTFLILTIISCNTLHDLMYAKVGQLSP